MHTPHLPCVSQLTHVTWFAYCILTCSYAATIESLVEERGIDVHLKTELAEVRGASQEAVFNLMGPDCRPTGEQTVMRYDMLHVTPPQGELALYVFLLWPLLAAAAMRGATPLWCCVCLLAVLNSRLHILSRCSDRVCATAGKLDSANEQNAPSNHVCTWAKPAQQQM